MQGHKGNFCLQTFVILLRYQLVKYDNHNRLDNNNEGCLVVKAHSCPRINHRYTFLKYNNQYFVTLNLNENKTLVFYNNDHWDKMIHKLALPAVFLSMDVSQRRY